MSGVPGDDRRGNEEPTPPSTNRILIWLVVGGIGLYFIVSGIFGLLGGGG